jgi:hypothetical protein
MKDLGSLRYFLGIEVAYSLRGYLLSQLKYIADILEWARLTDNKAVDTPIEVNARYSSSDWFVFDKSYSISYYCWELGISHHYSSRYCICCSCC